MFALYRLCSVMLSLKCCKVLQDELTELKKKLTHVGSVAKQLSAQLDHVTSAGVSNSKLTLDRHADTLQSRLQQHYTQLESTMDEHAKFAEKYRVIDKFLKTLPTEESKLSAVNISLVQQNISSVNEVLVKIENMKPEMARVNELRDEVSLTDDDVKQLVELNDRWSTTCTHINKQQNQLEQRLLQLQQFFDECQRWNDFVARLNADLQLMPSSSHESLLADQQKVEVAFITQFFS